MRRAQREERYEVAWNVRWEPVSYDEWTSVNTLYEQWLDHQRVNAERNHIEEMLAEEYERRHNDYLDEFLREEHLAEVRNEYTNYLAGNTPTEIPWPRPWPRVTGIAQDPAYVTDTIGWNDIMLISRSTYERYMEEWLLQEDILYYVYEDDDFTGKWELIEHPENKKKIAYFID